MRLEDSDSLWRGQIPSWESECSVYVLIMAEQVSDQSRKQIFKDTFRRKIDLRRMTSVYSGDRELARSLVVSALRVISDDIEKGEWEGPTVNTTNQNQVYKCNTMSQKYRRTPPFETGSIMFHDLEENLPNKYS